MGSNKEKVWLIPAKIKASKTRPLKGLMYWNNIFIMGDLLNGQR